MGYHIWPLRGHVITFDCWRTRLGASLPRVCKMLKKDVTGLGVEVGNIIFHFTFFISQSLGVEEADFLLDVGEVLAHALDLACELFDHGVAGGGA